MSNPIKLSAKEKIILGKFNLTNKLPFFGHLTYSLKTQEAKQIKVAQDKGIQVFQDLKTWAIDGETFFYNPKWIDTLSPEETAFVLCHSVMHCVLEHLSPERRGFRKQERWDDASDYVVNDICVGQKSRLLSMPEGMLYDPKFRGMAVERIFGMLGDKPRPEGMDIHLPMGGDKEGNCPDWRLKAIQAYNYSRSQGTEPWGISELITNILKPKVSWQEALRRFITEKVRDDYSFMRPNRKTAYLDLYLPSFSTLGIGHIALAFDTSGSISKENLAQFVAEMNAMYASYSMTLHVIQCDAAIQDYRIIEPFESLDAKDFEVKGRGGTNFQPVFEFIEKEKIEPAALIFQTDGYGDFPEKAPGYPVLWVSTTDVVYPFGEVTCIGDSHE